MNEDAADVPPATPSPESRPVQRWLARLAFAFAAAAIVTLLSAAGFRSGVRLVLVGLTGLAVVLVAAWWFLIYRNVLRWFAAALAVAAPVTVATLYISAGLLWVVVVSAALWILAGVAGRMALKSADNSDPIEYETPPPGHPFIIMNPKSGSGKVARFGLAEKARALGAEVFLMDGPGHVDVAALARSAVDAGADLLSVAGGDGTQAIVAAVAAERGIPFMVISAGTRNHFAMDLGLDREDPSTCLDALTDGVEMRVDLGRIGERTFVNNASFGAYAAVVQSPTYRDDKWATALEMLPDLLVGHSGPHLRITAGDTVVHGPQAALVSNNPYDAGEAAGLGRRIRLDTGRLGVLAINVVGAREAALLLRGRRSRSLTVLSASEVVVDADAPWIPVGIDGEAVSLPTPVRCTIRRGALRVRVPRHRPGVRPLRPVLDWRRLSQLVRSIGRNSK